MPTKDPLGRQPRPLTGQRTPRDTDEAMERASAATKAAKTIWIDHPPQDAAARRVRKLLKDSAGIRDVPLEGLRLSEPSHAGKSAIFEHLAQVLAEEALQAGARPNPFQLVHVSLDKKTSVKAVYQDILLKMEDPDWSTGTEKILKQRIKEFVRRLDVQACVIDEAQHLRMEKGAAADVTDTLKAFLDSGIVPIILVGNQDSRALFEHNEQFAARLGEPLQLRGLNPKRRTDKILFHNFVLDFAEELEASGATRTLPEFDSDYVLDGLMLITSGHVGRVVRVLRAAVDSAAWRNALTVEPFDLSNVARRYAMPTWKIARDPFSFPHV